jgi:hypothetical protein
VVSAGSPGACQRVLAAMLAGLRSMRGSPTGFGQP